MHSAQRQSHHIQQPQHRSRISSLLLPGFGSGLQPRIEILSLAEAGELTGSEPDQREDLGSVRITLLIIRMRMAG